jgi:hypothetical protein
VKHNIRVAYRILGTERRPIHRGECSCGWRGQWRASSLEAAEDRGAHRLDVRGSWQRV